MFAVFVARGHCWLVFTLVFISPGLFIKISTHCHLGGATAACALRRLHLMCRTLCFFMPGFMMFLLAQSSSLPRSLWMSCCCTCATAVVTTLANHRLISYLVTALRSVMVWRLAMSLSTYAHKDAYTTLLAPVAGISLPSPQCSEDWLKPTAATGCIVT